MDNVRDSVFPVRRVGLTVPVSSWVDLGDIGGDYSCLIVLETNATGATWGNMLVRLGRQGDWIPIARGVKIKGSGFSQLSVRNLSAGAAINVTFLLTNDPDFDYSFQDNTATPTAIP